ncbi:hypothetical protein D3C80_1931380 [compost metagenome]
MVWLCLPDPGTRRGIACPMPARLAGRVSSRLIYVRIDWVFNPGITISTRFVVEASWCKKLSDKLAII